MKGNPVITRHLYMACGESTESVSYLYLTYRAASMWREDSMFIVYGLTIFFKFVVTLTKQNRRGRDARKSIPN